MEEEEEGDTMKERYGKWDEPAGGQLRQHVVAGAGGLPSYDPELFFPIGKAGLAPAKVQRAKAVCAGCPVRQACLEFALETGQEFGVGEGTTRTSGGCCDGRGG